MKAVPANRYFVFFSIAIGGCLIDLATKRWMFDWLGMPREKPTYWVWNRVFGFQTSLNEGALFGMGQGMVVVFAVLSVAAALGVLCWLFWAGAARDWLLTVALGCVTAGIFGNLYDRTGMPGLTWNYGNQWHEIGEPVYAVRDWVLVMIGRWPWPNFNVADSLLVCGAAMLVWHALFAQQRAEDPSAEREAS
jgi:signal peptidase II